MPTFAYILIVIAVLIVFQVVRMSRRASSHHFECPTCGKRFNVGAIQYMFTAHNFEGQCRVTCPGCGKTAMLPPLKGSIPGGTDGTAS